MGADVIRGSDGTNPSDEITGAEYGIYSTICIIRDHNAWAKQPEGRCRIVKSTGLVWEDICIFMRTHLSQDHL